ALLTKLSFRPERPDFFLRAEFWRVGLRSGGIPLPLSHSPTLPLSHSPPLPLCHSPTLPLSHSPTLPLSHSPPLPLSHSPTLPLSPSRTLPDRRPSTSSPFIVPELFSEVVSCA